jgi:hypothetical protein
VKYYVGQTHVESKNGKIIGYETVLTKPDTEKVTREMVRRMKVIGVPNIYAAKYVKRRYNKLVRESNKRRKAARQLTLAEVAEIMGDES